MKLRIRHNSVRLRLSQTEVAQLRDAGLVEESVNFGAGYKLDYRIESKIEASVIAAEYREGSVSVSVPMARVKEWADSNQVGMAADQGVGNGQALRVLIEKDFKCLDSTDPEENADTFPNPSEGKVC